MIKFHSSEVPLHFRTHTYDLDMTTPSGATKIVGGDIPLDLAKRKQNDHLQDEYSIETGLDFTDVEPITRQEFKDEADLNILLARYGVAQPTRPMKYGEEIDYTLDLQTALASLEAARRAHFNVPDELRAKYPDWQSVLNGAESGQYQQDLANLAERKAKAAGKLTPDGKPVETPEESDKPPQE